MKLKKTALQKAALDRLVFFEKELEKRGLTVRHSFEQEFLLTNDLTKEDLLNRLLSIEQGVLQYTGEPQPRGAFTDYENVVGTLGKKWPALHEIEWEFSVSPRKNSKKKPLNVYEAKFDSAKAARHKPHDVALQVLGFREEAAQTLEANPQLLHKYSDEEKPGDVNMVLDALPLKNIPELQEFQERFMRNQTIGLHSSISVYDAMGHDLLDNDGFCRAQAESMMTLQSKAGLGYLQNQQGVDRIAANPSTPISIGLAYGHKGGKSSGYSLLERGVEHRYLENRLSPSTADPLVVAALELAAIYEMVTTTPGLKNKQTITMRDVNRLWKNDDAKIVQHREQIEQTLEPWKERLEKHSELRALLGDQFYDAMRDTLGKQQAAR